MLVQQKCWAKRQYFDGSNCFLSEILLSTDNKQLPQLIIQNLARYNLQLSKHSKESYLQNLSFFIFKSYFNSHNFSTINFCIDYNILNISHNFKLIPLCCWSLINQRTGWVTSLKIQSKNSEIIQFYFITYFTWLWAQVLQQKQSIANPIWNPKIIWFIQTFKG